ncbi:Lipoprotein-releasing system ATP-binding protein LolD [Pontiella desulfatans]|uniref:Lipoprotein-releasing system ATP-binding protein LolD n=1 Tax=Pontiella desulfatans TaxID=2750659 RepID=A0A6C2TZ38_PONDE|nr:ABC transporter ATP-binding protein [Pontiella desulfatans]VGO12849.1 Lipoprotein-releasing system ATP-binding protein LolD [Pontiella desulfatans]
MGEKEETILRAENIKRSYTIGKTTLDVLKGVSLSVDAGETLSIMGESGSGKSTLLHVLGGLDTPKDGVVRFNGHSVYGMSSQRRARFRAENVGYVFQSFHLLPELDIVENVALPAMAQRSRGDAKARAKELLVEVGLGERVGHRPQELSGGEQQRVAIARALMNDPDIIFCDEPTGNLDSRTGEKVLNYLFQLVEARRHTLVLVTHSQDVASRCSRELFLKDGLLDNQGKMNEDIFR